MEPVTFGGKRVIESVALVQDGQPYTVRRTWRERLFSRPWRPCVSTRIVVPKVPYRGALWLDAHTVLMHPAFVRELRAELDRMRVATPSQVA
jgi:hypothetical protein